MKNYISIKLPAVSSSESLSRNIIATFASQLNPTIDKIDELKMIVSEAVTNSVVHAYPDISDGDIEIYAELCARSVHVVITDHGKGIEDLENALNFRVTEKGKFESAGVGFTIMKAYSDSCIVGNNSDGGVCVDIVKQMV